MKQFKKVLFLLLSVLTLVGCGAKKPENPEPGTPDENPDETPGTEPEELYINIFLIYTWLKQKTTKPKQRC